MLLSSSSRAAPPKPLRFNSGGPGTKSSTDRSYLSIKHLLPSTPIPSPSLPSILPRHGKKPPKLNSRRIVRFLLWLSFVIGIYYLLSFGKTRDRQSHSRLGSKNLSTFATSSGQTYEIVEASELPEHPTPLALTDSNGNHHWTISIPDALKFPLLPTEYVDICSQVEEVARHVAGGGKHHKGVVEGNEGYYHEDSNFIDVDDAIARNFLPPPSLKPHNGNDDTLPICEKSLTYVLSAHDAGLGSALLGLWLSYSLALSESRTFFIDDSQFPYGNYSTFFADKLAPPACRLPPPSHRVPCPRQAKHLIASAATTPWLFGPAFHTHFSQRDIFAMARRGYEALFHLRPEDETYITNRVNRLRNSNALTLAPTPDDAPIPTTGLVGIHIRRGDRHPFSLAYSRNYIPPATYMARAHRLVGQATPQWTFLLASDDADLYNDNHPDLPATLRAQERISLASKKALAQMGHVAKNALGWEGGFFKDVFWGLGLSEEEKFSMKRTGRGGGGSGSPMPMKEKGRFGEKDGEGREKRVHHHDNTKGKGKGKTGAAEGGKRSADKKGKGHAIVQVVDEGAEERDYRTNPTKEALQLRELLGRAYLLDLAVLAQSDKVVCGVSANACRILAVMLGWERAFDKNDWNNVDGAYEWRIMDY